MKFARLAAALLLIPALAFGLAACGSDGKDEYASQIEGVLQPLGDQFNELGPAINGSNDLQATAEAVGSVESSIQSSVGDLEAITAPDGVESVHEDLIATLEKYGDELSRVQNAAESGDLAKYQKVALGLPAASDAFEQRLSEVQDAAIDAGVPIQDDSDG